MVAFSLDIQPIQCSIRLITPELARSWLGQSLSTRRIDRNRLRNYASDMRRGLWRLNGEALIFGKSGKLLDGRIRLHACVEANVDFHSLVVHNIEDRHFPTIDALRKRTLIDIMTIRGERHGQALSGALRFIHRYLNGMTRRTAATASSQELVGLLDVFPEIRVSVDCTVGLKNVLPHSMAAGLHYLMMLANPDLAIEFFDDLSSPVYREPQTPSERLRALLDEKKDGAGRTDPLYLLTCAVKAWNATVLKKFSWTPPRTFDSRQFPKIAGLPEMNAAAIGDRLKADAQRAPNDRLIADVSADQTYLTPDMAQDFLSRNSNNRNVSARVVSKYCRDILSGKWALNGGTIKIGRDGKLLDGQHRCAAVIKASTPIPVIIVKNVPNESFGTIDLSQSRAASQLLAMEGETNGVALASALRRLWRLENGKAEGRLTTPSNVELLEYRHRHPNLMYSINIANRKPRVAMPMSLASVLHYRFRQIDPDRADSFFARLQDGSMLERGNPIYRLREVLLRNHASRTAKRLSDKEIEQLTLAAWNRYAKTNGPCPAPHFEGAGHSAA